MVEERFSLAYEKGNWWAVRDGDIILWKEETIATLNELHNKNEQLKQHIKRVFQEEYNKCDIPVWRRQYVKSLAEKLGVDLNE